MSETAKWTVQTMPDLSGKTAIVTGANVGLGFKTARALAYKGARTVLACRNIEKGETAGDLIRKEAPHALLDVRELDLANLSSIRRFAETFKAEHSTLHILCNNAGVMALPYRTTADGFEMQFGTNHLGHFALTGLLIDQIIQSGAGRVVTVSSNYHRPGVINFDDLQGQKLYKKWDAYSQSKLANLLFTYELQRKLESGRSDTISVAAHPGYSATNLQLAGPKMDRSKIQRIIMLILNNLLAQSALMGALPTLFAATSPDVKGGDYIGPGGLMEMRGYPTKVTSSEASHDQIVAQKLWSVSEELTGVKFRSLDS